MNKKQIKELLSKYSSKKSQQIDDSDRIALDLNIQGDDASEFLDVLQDEFGVDFTSFNFNEYFLEESIQLSTYSLFPFLRNYLMRNKKTLTVADLLKIIENKSH